MPSALTEDFRIVRDWTELWRYRCPACPGTNRIVPGCGPRPARVLCLSEAPGENEDKLGRPFCGLAGYELDHTYLPLAGLDRSEVAIDNVRHCRPPNNRKPSPYEIRECSSHFLPSEIEMVDPEFIILMGGSACSLVPWLDLETHHGIPQWAKVFQWEGWVFPTYHPAAGLHETSTMIELLEDFERLKELLDGRPPEEMQPKDQWPNPFYREIHAEELRRLLEWHDPLGYQRLGIDQENQNGELFSVQVSRMPGTGWLIRGDDRESLRVLKEEVEGGGLWCLLHNALGDMDWLEEKADIHVPVQRLRDTMQEAYALGNLPQGLKPLAYRLAGMKMRSYDQVVDGPSRREVARWLEEAKEFVLPEISEKPILKRPPPVTVVEEYRTKKGVLKTRKRKIKQEMVEVGVKYMAEKHPVQATVLRILGHLEEGEPGPGEKKYDPWKAWQKEKEKWLGKLKEAEELRDAPEWVKGKAGEEAGAAGVAEEKAEKALETIGRIEGELGRMPSRGLRRVEWGEALEYACKDPDGTLRVAEEMEKRAEKLGRVVAEVDLT